MTKAALRQIESADDDELLRSIDRWLERDVKPVVKQYDHDDLYPSAIVEQMKRLGLFGATISPEYGGLGLGITEASVPPDFPPLPPRATN